MDGLIVEFNSFYFAFVLSFPYSSSGPEEYFFPTNIREKISLERGIGYMFNPLIPYILAIKI